MLPLQTPILEKSFPPISIAEGQEKLTSDQALSKLNIWSFRHKNKCRCWMHLYKQR